MLKIKNLIQNIDFTNLNLKSGINALLLCAFLYINGTVEEISFS